MKPQDIEAKVAKLRQAHTEAFKVHDWQTAQRIRSKILLLWQRWERAMEQAQKDLTPGSR